MGKNIKMPFIQGTCMSMCPLNELIFRQRENLIHKLECRINFKGERTKLCDSQKMVKEFVRCAAGQKIDANSLRPLGILKKTVYYLLSLLDSSSDICWKEKYEYVENRLRAVRQDLIVQGIINIEAISVLAPIVRFYIYSNYSFAEYEEDKFDSYLNLTQLNENLLSIIYIYNKHSYKCESHIVKTYDKEESSDIKKGNMVEEGENELEDASANCEDTQNISQDAIANCIDTEIKPQDVTANCVDYSFSDVADIFDKMAISKYDNDGDFMVFSDTSLIENDESQKQFPPYTNVRRVPTPEFDNEYFSIDKIDSTQESKYRNTNLDRFTLMEEMEALYQLINLGNNEALSHYLELPSDIRYSHLVSSCFKASLSWTSGNHLPLIRLWQQLSPILCCAIHLHLNKVQRHVLGVMSSSHNSSVLKFSVEDLRNYLSFASSDEVLKVCSYYGLVTSDEDVQFHKDKFKWDKPVHKLSKSEHIESKFKKKPISLYYFLVAS